LRTKLEWRAWAPAVHPVRSPACAGNSLSSDDAGVCRFQPALSVRFTLCPELLDGGVRSSAASTDPLSLSRLAPRPATPSGTPWAPSRAARRRTESGATPVTASAAGSASSSERSGLAERPSW
jgi:hypothetical protein